MSVAQFKQVSYGLTQALIPDAPLPIVSNRAPGVADKAQIGTLWVDKSANNAYILVSIVNNQATWGDIVGAGGPGNFTSLTVNPGNATITAGNLIVTAGSGTFGTTVTAGTGISATTGNIVAAAGNINATLGSMSAGTTVTAGTGITATTGNITATTGNIVATAGDITAVLGDITANAGDISALTGDIIAAAGDVTVTLGNVVVTAGHVTVGAAGIYVGAGDPNGALAAPANSLYLNSAGAGVNDRLWVNTTGAMVWAFVITSA